MLAEPRKNPCDSPSFTRRGAPKQNEKRIFFFGKLSEILKKFSTFLNIFQHFSTEQKKEKCTPKKMFRKKNSKKKRFKNVIFLKKKKKKVES